MARIPANINGVAVEFAETVNNDVNDWVIEGLQVCIKSDVSPTRALENIFISSAHDGTHDQNSRHYMGKAVDISRLNGKHIITYPDDPEVQAIVQAIQETFENYPERRENFGPYFKKKLGKPWAVPGHQDHIHLSVN